MRSAKVRILSFLTAASIVLLSLPQFVIPAFADDTPVRDEPIIVSLGDSYASGEGNSPLFGQNNKKVGEEVNPDWIAHRSESAWSGMLTLTGVEGTVSAHRGTNWFFAAASNAKITNFKDPQAKSCNRSDIGSGTAYLPPQFDIFNGLTLTDNDFVIISIGGNDLGFVDIMTKAITLGRSSVRQ